MTALSGEIGGSVGQTAEPTAKKPERYEALSLLRVIACLGIVLLHTANITEILYGGTAPGGAAVAMGTVYCLMWAVPVFLMVSGALLLNPDRDIPQKRVLGRYFPRVFLSLLASCILFRLFDMIMDGEKFTLMFIPDGVYRMFTGNSWSHLWYLYLLIGLYLMLPFYRMVTAHSTKEQLRYLLLLFFAVLSCLPLASIFDVPSAFTIQTASIYPFYFLIGYVIFSGKWKLPKKTAGMVLGAATVLIIILTAFNHLRFEAGEGALEGWLGSYANTLVVLQAVSLFILLHDLNLDRLPGWAMQTLHLLDECGFGIYLLHMVLLRFLLRYRGWNPLQMGVWTVYIIAIGVFLMTFAFVATFRPTLKILTDKVKGVL